MRVLFLSQYYPPEVEAGANRIRALASGLACAGHDVTVLCGLPNFPTGRRPSVYRCRLFVLERRAGVRIIRVWVLPTANRGKVRRGVNYATYVASSCLAALTSRGRWDAVIASSPPLFTGLAGLVVARLARSRYVFEVRDLWPESMRALDAIGNGLLFRALQRLKLHIYRKCDRLVAVTDSFRERIVDDGIDEAKVVVIKNGADTGLFRPRLKSRRLARQYGLDGKFVVMYIGTHGISQGLTTVVEAAHLLKGELRFHFVFLGEGADKTRVQKAAARRSLANVTFLPQCSREDAAQHLSLADVGVIPLRDLDVFRDVLPSKMFEYMASGVPIVLAVRGEAAQVLKDAGAGQAVSPERPAEMAAAIRRMARDPRLREACAANGRDYAVTNHSMRRLCEQYEELLDDLATVPGMETTTHKPAG